MNKHLFPVLALLILGGACGLQDQTGEWSQSQTDLLLKEISQDQGAQPFLANPEQDYLKCVAGEFMREYTPAGVDSLPRLEKDVVRAQAYLECRGEIESDADGNNKADEAFQRR